MAINLLAELRGEDLSSLIHELTLLELLDRRKGPVWLPTPEPHRPFEPPKPQGVITKEEWKQKAVTPRPAADQDGPRSSHLNDKRD